ncbi:YfjP family GTPase [Nocardioides donggukensis]|uniref:50S ribosome-binding GTPase n=1 Tax=Nocardioides donggukensis TaxID=2774019 RepID=A0A927Q0W4_9ACTN|nr:YfjP family GTPase [Nocardioides donggukensis]MBD8868889.1 50S ribosome-binding GTPase [Nocardioides donggukensis]
MTALLEGARKMVSRKSDVGARVAGLQVAVEHARGRLDDGLVDAAAEVVDRASGRLRLSAEHTVIAIAGATGSGKSSTFNALTGLELSAVGVRRPTTSWATACVWGREGAEELLEWLGIPSRHQVTRDSMLDTGREDTRLQGTVLLDLPDHDSTEVSHHLEVDRLVKLADLLVWVLDPQKYADAAIHERYLKQLSGHAGVMLVVLNHIDSVPVAGRQAMLDDVRRLLDADGLEEVPVLAISAREGTGLDDLKDEMARRVASKKATRTRLEADVREVAEALAEASGTGKPQSPRRERMTELENAFADAAGVPVVVEAVAASTRHRANRATGWPVTAWLSRLRPDPLKRLHLDLGKDGRALTRAGRTSVPEQTPVQRARVDSAVRELADEVGADLSRPWQTAIRRASTSRLDDVGDRLDQGLASTDLGVAKLPWWAGLVRALQWLLILSAITGGVWLGALAVMAYLRAPDPGTPAVLGVPLPTLLLLGGVLAGVLLALLSRVLVSLTARSRAAAADRRLRAKIRTVCVELVLSPVEAELSSYDQVRHGLSAALR